MKLKFHLLLFFPSFFGVVQSYISQAHTINSDYLKVASTIISCLKSNPGNFNDISWTLFFKMGNFSWIVSKGDFSWTLLVTSRGQKCPREVLFLGDQT